MWSESEHPHQPIHPIAFLLEGTEAIKKHLTKETIV